MKKLLLLSTFAIASSTMHTMEMPSQETLEKLLCSDNNETATLALYASARKDYFSGNHGHARIKFQMCATQEIIPWVTQEAREYLQKIEHAKQIEIAKSNAQLPAMIIRPSFQHLDTQEQLMQRTLDHANHLFYNVKDLFEARKVYRRVLNLNTPGDIAVESQHNYARTQIIKITEHLAQEKASNAKAKRNIFSNNE